MFVKSKWCRDERNEHWINELSERLPKWKFYNVVLLVSAYSPLRASVFPFVLIRRCTFANVQVCSLEGRKQTDGNLKLKLLAQVHNWRQGESERAREREQSATQRNCHRRGSVADDQVRPLSTHAPPKGSQIEGVSFTRNKHQHN